MPSGFAIRDAQVQDAEKIAAIFAPYVRDTVITFDMHPPTPREWIARMHRAAAKKLPFLVATFDDELIGYALVAPWRSKPAYGHTVEDSIYLAPHHVGQGFGRQLLAELMLRATSAGVRQIVAIIADSGSPASIALHARAGFEPAGRLQRVGFKHDRWLDVILMQRELGAP